MRPRIHVAMPETEMYKKTMAREQIVSQYGEATVARAEVATILNIMFATGIVRGSEFVDILLGQCRRIEDQRRMEANLDEDKG